VPGCSTTPAGERDIDRAIVGDRWGWGYSENGSIEVDAAGDSGAREHGCRWRTDALVSARVLAAGGEGEPLGTDGAKEAGDGSASDRAIAGKAVRPVVVVVLLHDAIADATLGPTTTTTARRPRRTRLRIVRERQAVPEGISPAVKSGAYDHSIDTLRENLDDEKDRRVMFRTQGLLICVAA